MANDTLLKKRSGLWRCVNIVKRFISNPMNILILACMVVLGYLMIYPLVEIIDTTFSVARGEAKKLGQEVGSFTMFYWKRCFAEKVSKSLFYTPFKNYKIVSIFLKKSDRGIVKKM